MRKSLLALLGAASGLLLSASLHAVGMGGINVGSALGQPLKARIDLLDVDKAQKDTMVARLATPDAYKNAGLEYPYGDVFKFEVQTGANGESYIEVSSAQAINDPFLSLLIELSWPAGKLSREYTFLLDPVDYVPVQPAQAAVQPVAPSVQAAQPANAAAQAPVVTAPVAQATPIVAEKPAEQVAASAATPSPSEAPEQTAAPAEAPAQAASGEAPVTAATPATPEAPATAATPAAPAMPANKQWVAVRRGYTLEKIAQKYKQPDMSLDRMLVALYRANIDKFDGNNMNRIAAGRILRLPTADEYSSVTVADAVKEIRAQAADWNAYRQKLASAAPPVAHEEGAQQVASGKISSSVADKAPVTAGSATEVLRLSKGEAPGDQAVGAGAKPMSPDERKNAAQENAIAKAKTEQETQTRTAMLEQNLEDMKRLAQLKAEAAALAQGTNAPAAPAAPPPVAAPAAAAAVAVPAALPAAAPPAAPKPAPARPVAPGQMKPKPQPVKTEPSLLDQIMGEPLYQMGIAAIVLGLVAIAILMRRRKKKAIAEDSGEDTGDSGSAVEHTMAPMEPAVQMAGAARAESAQPVAASAQASHVDPVSEAELFLNFGRDAQAEEILKDGLQSAPDNHEIHLKLLEIYAKRGDAHAFAEIARQLQDSGDTEAWDKAVDIERRMQSLNAKEAVTSAKADAGGAAAHLTALSEVPGPLGAATAHHSAVVDLDFDEVAPPVATAKHEPAAALDIPSMHAAIPASPAASATDVGDLAFDVPEGASASPPGRAEEVKVADVGGISFGLDTAAEGSGKATASSVSPAQEIDFSDISLNFDDVNSTPKMQPGEGKDEHWQEVATKLDLAKAYQEMGDNDGAREIIDEVMREGDAGQREVAQSLLVQLG